MSIIDNNFADPIISQWNRIGEDKVSLKIENELCTVTTNMFALRQIPDMQYRVQIEEYVEIDIRDEIKLPQQFKVDYEMGYVYFHSSKEGEKINVKQYYGRGVSYYPANRVYTGTTDLGEITGTLDETLEKIDQVYDATTNLDQSIQTGIETKQDLDGSISDSVVKKGELDASIAEGYEINETLSNPDTGTIKQAHDINATLVENTATGDELNDNLAQKIQVGSQLKTDLSDKITEGNPLNTTLGDTVQEAKDINQTLVKPDGTIDKANSAKSALDSSIATANTSRGELNSTISQADSKKIELQDIVDELDKSSPWVEVFSSEESQTTYTLTQGQYRRIEMMIVSVQGVIIDPYIDFTLVEDEGNNAIELNETLPVGTEVRIQVLQTVPIASDDNVIIP